MTFASLLESLLPIGIGLLLLTATTLGGGLLLTRLLKRHTDTATQTLLLRATFTATLVGILLAFAPLPRPDFKLIAPIAISKGENAGERNVSPTPPVPVGPAVAPVAAAPLASPSPQPAFPVFFLLTSAWLVGTLLLLARLLTGYGYIARLGKYAPVISPFSSNGGFYWKAFATAQRQPSKIVTVESADLFLVDLPFLPVFLALPQDVDTRFDRTALNAILAHERSHLERRDGWWNLAAQTLSCLLWFQPLIWLLMREMERNSEAASDESALVYSDCTARDYVEMLLRFAEFPQRQHPLLQSLRGITPLLTRSTLEERIYTLMTRATKPTRSPASPRLRATIFGSLVLLTLVSAVTFGIRSSAAPVAATQPPEEITFEVVNTNTVDALKQLLSQAGMQLAEGDEKVLADAPEWMTLKVTNPSYQQILRVFLKVSSPKNKWYLYEMQGNTVHLTSLALDKNNLPLKRITLQYGPGPLRGALEEMLRGTGFVVRIPEDLRIGKRLKYQNATLSEAIPALLKSYPEALSWVAERGEISVQTVATIQKERESSQKNTEELLTTVPVTLDFKNASLPQAIDDLCNAARLQYSIDVGVKGRVTLSIKNKTAGEALSELLKQAETPVEYSIENGVIIVKTKP